MNRMVKNLESGFALNVANFETLIGYCQKMGTVYNPSNPNITLTALKAQLTQLKTSIDGLNSSRDKYNIATANREQAFAALPKLITRIYSSAKASGADETNINDLKPLIRKLRGKRASVKVTSDQPNTAEEPKRTNSVSQLSFENRLQNFETLLHFVSGIEIYNPNEEDLKITSLQALLTNLRNLNSEAKEASIEVENARILRNIILKDPETGVIATSKDVKNYVMSLYGFDSNQYNQVKSLQFR